MDLTEVVPHVYRLRLRMSGLFLLLDERVTIIDTGPRWSRGRIVAALRDLGRDPSEVERVVITHGHFDHYGSLQAIGKREAPERMAHPRDAEVVRGERRSQIRPALFSAVYHLLLGHLLEPSSAIDTHIEDGDVIPVLGGLRVVHTPGHTDGHVSLLLEEYGLLLSADALQVNRRGELTPPLIFGERADAVRSLAKLAALDFEVLAPSHFAVQRDGARERVQELAMSVADESSSNA
jgi:glyoxylase-like metal-dependent hydrolase (beta-lactamase superfamily II)